MMDSIIKDISLAPEGELKLDWAKKHMPVLNLLVEDAKKNQSLEGVRVTASLHVEAKTGILALALKDMGAEVALSACNPLSTQDEIAAALAKAGIKVFAVHGCDDKLYNECIEASLEHKPDFIIDDGGDLVELIHTKRRDLLENLKGGCEETTTGIMRLREMTDKGTLEFPMLGVNDADCKHLFDNRYGTGQSALTAIMGTTNLLIAGKTVVVAGYGWCGRGFAMRAKAMGARVIVTEIDAVKAIEAVMDGFEVMPMIEAAPLGDFFVTLTGNCDVIRKEHYEVIKDGAVLANAGHFDVEINIKELKEMAHYDGLARENIEGYTFSDGRRVFVLGEGRLVNLACEQGHPADIMDMSFAVQAGSLLYLAEHGGEFTKGLHPVPAAVDKKIAAIKLATMGCTIDVLTPKQEKYWYANEVR